jgi:hypothetical protein
VDLDPVAVAQRLWHQTRVGTPSSSPAIELPKFGDS